MLRTGFLTCILYYIHTYMTAKQENLALSIFYLQHTFTFHAYPSCFTKMEWENMQNIRSCLINFVDIDPFFPSSNPRRPPPTSQLCPTTSPQLSSRGRRVVGGIKSFPISGNYGSFSAHKSSYSFHALFSPPLHHSSLSLSSPPPSISHPLFSHPFSLFLLHFLGR